MEEPSLEAATGGSPQDVVVPDSSVATHEFDDVTEREHAVAENELAARSDALAAEFAGRVGWNAEIEPLPKTFIEWWWFRSSVYLAIILNSVQLGVQTDYTCGSVYHLPDGSDVPMKEICISSSTFFHLDLAFNGIFLLELACKLVVLRCSYFKDPWNLFDIAMVVLGVADAAATLIAEDGGGFGSVSVLRIMRILRLARTARAFKLMGAFKELLLILNGMANAMRTIVWVTMIFSIVVYCCSIFCVQTIGHNSHLYPGTSPVERLEDEWATEFRSVNPIMYFGNIQRSMFTLLMTTTLVEFREHARGVLERQPYVAVFYILFIAFNTMGLLNVIIGVICDCTLENSQELLDETAADELREKLRVLCRIQETIFALDSDKGGSIGADEIHNHWEEPEMRELWGRLGIPPGMGPLDVLTLLDDSGDRSISYEEFLENFFLLTSKKEFTAQCTTTWRLNRNGQRLSEFLERLTQLEEAQERLLTKVDVHEIKVESGRLTCAKDQEALRHRRAALLKALAEEKRTQVLAEIAATGTAEKLSACAVRHAERLGSLERGYEQLLRNHEKLVKSQDTLQKRIAERLRLVTEAVSHKWRRPRDLTPLEACCANTGAADVCVLDGREQIDARGGGTSGMYLPASPRAPTAADFASSKVKRRPGSRFGPNTS